MRVGRSADKSAMTRNSRPDHGFLIRIGKPDPSLHNRLLGLIDTTAGPIFTRQERANKGFLTRVGKADKSFLTRVGKSDNMIDQPQIRYDTLIGHPRSETLIGQPRSVIMIGQPKSGILIGQSKSDNLSGQSQNKRHKTGSKTYFLTRVGRAKGTTKRKSYFTRIGRSPSSF